MENNEFRVLIKHCFLMKKDTIQTKAWLDKCYGTSSPSYSTVKKWHADFKRGNTSTDDAPRSGRPNEAVTEENIRKIHRIVLNDRKVKVSEIADTLHISTERVRNILHEYLDMKKLSARWVPRMLTIDQKQKRVDDSEYCLAYFQRNPSDFLRRFITMDETWIHYYTPESNRQSAEWLQWGENRPKRPKTQRSAGKVMASIFWDSHGIIIIDYLEKGRTITGEYYVTLLDRLDNAIKEKRPHLQKKKVLFHHDNAPPHSSLKAAVKLEQLGYELIPHPPYSPDLAPSDYYLYPNLKRWLQGKRFYTNDEVIFETEGYFAELDKSYYSKGIQMLEDRWKKCIALRGDYTEE